LTIDGMMVEKMERLPEVRHTKFLGMDKKRVVIFTFDVSRLTNKSRHEKSTVQGSNFA